MKRKEAIKLNLRFYRDDSGELRRTRDDARWQKRRQPDANRIAARKAGEKHYTDEDGFRRQTQNGQLVAKARNQPVPTERRGHCAQHGWVRFSIAFNECLRCLEEHEEDRHCFIHGTVPHNVAKGHCLSCRTLKGHPRSVATNPIGFYLDADGNVQPAPEY